MIAPKPPHVALSAAWVDENGFYLSGGHHGGRTITYPTELENDILQLFSNSAILHCLVSIENICVYAQASSLKHCQSFKRVVYSLPQASQPGVCTTLAQPLPTNQEKKIESFNSFVYIAQLNEEFNDMVVNMDQSAVYFDIVPTKTVDRKGTNQ